MEVKRAYSVIHKQRGLAYGTPFSPIYGENTVNSMRKALVAMGLCPGDVFCDVGSGSGAPSIHAACEYPGITAYGFELMGSRWIISQSILLGLLRQGLEAATRVLFAHVDLVTLQDFGTCSHLYSFDLAFPMGTLEAYAKAVNQSRHVRCLASFKKPAILAEAGFRGLVLRTQLRMKQVGSGECRMLHVYDVVREEKEETKFSSWNLTALPPPTDRMESIDHKESYPRGEEARLTGVEVYKEWVKDQMDFSEGIKTRSAKRQKVL